MYIAVPLMDSVCCEDLSINSSLSPSVLYPLTSGSYVAGFTSLLLMELNSGRELHQWKLPLYDPVISHNPLNLV